MRISVLKFPKSKYLYKNGKLNKNIILEIGLDLATVWQETAEALADYYKSEGFTYTNIIEVLPHVIDLFEKLLFKVEKKNEKKKN